MLPAHLPAPQAGGTGSAGLRAAGTTRHRDGCAVQPAALWPRDLGCSLGLPQRKAPAPDPAGEGPSCLRSRRSRGAAATAEGRGQREEGSHASTAFVREGIQGGEHGARTRCRRRQCCHTVNKAAPSISCSVRARRCATARPPPPPRDAHRPAPPANPVFAFPVGPSAFHLGKPWSGGRAVTTTARGRANPRRCELGAAGHTGTGAVPPPAQRCTARPEPPMPRRAVLCHRRGPGAPTHRGPPPPPAPNSRGCRPIAASPLSAAPRPFGPNTCSGSGSARPKGSTPAAPARPRPAPWGGPTARSGLAVRFRLPQPCSVPSYRLLSPRGGTPRLY